MTLGRGLESLIPPQEPFNKTQNDLGKIPQAENQEKQEQGLFKPPDNPLPELGLSDSSGIARGSVRELSDDEDQSTKGIVFQIETEKINPNPHQPRRNFDEVGLQELANSIREFGIIQPLVVTKIEKESDRGWEVSYELVAGERRLLAAKILGLRTVPAIVRQVPIEHEKLEVALTENIQRTNLNPIEFARAIAKLQEDFRLTQREVATRLGKSREVIANTLRLLSLPSEMQEAVATGKISESQARLLLSVEDPASRDRLFQEILSNNLTVREVNQRVKQLKGDAAVPPAKTIDPELLALKDKLEAVLGAPVKLQREGEGGKLTISFYSKEELEGILNKFRRNDNQSL